MIIGFSDDSGIEYRVQLQHNTLVRTSAGLEFYQTVVFAKEKEEIPIRIEFLPIENDCNFD